MLLLDLEFSAGNSCKLLADFMLTGPHTLPRLAALTTSMDTARWCQKQLDIAFPILLKPFTIQELYEVIDRLLV